MNDKALKTSFSSRFQILPMLCWKVQKMIFYPPLTCLWGKYQNGCFQLLRHAKNHQKLLYQFLDQFWNVRILLWICEAFVDFFTVRMSDIGWVKWANNTCRSFMKTLRNQISVDDAEWTLPNLMYHIH